MIEITFRHALSCASGHRLFLSDKILEQNPIARRDSECGGGVYGTTSVTGIFRVEGCRKGRAKAWRNYRLGAFSSGQIEPIGEIRTVSAQRDFETFLRCAKVEGGLRTFNMAYWPPSLHWQNPKSTSHHLIGCDCYMLIIRTPSPPVALVFPPALASGNELLGSIPSTTPSLIKNGFVP